MAVEKLESIKLNTSGLIAKYDTLTSRDKIALIALSLFLFATFGLYGGFKVHQQSVKQQASYDSKLTDYFWIRGQAGNLSNTQIQSGDTNRSAQVIEKTISSSGVVNPQVVPTNDGVQLSFEHSSQALVSRIITSLKNQNIKFIRIHISQVNNGEAYRVEANTAS